MAVCVVPQCRCVRYQPNDQSKGRLIAFKPDCGGCGHTRSLHRTPTPNDTLITEELRLAASIPCCSLIPIPDLPAMSDFFSPYDLIPVPPDEMDAQVSNVLCLCEGFSSTHVASILQQFSNSSLNDIHESLPRVKCARCTHPLLTHQKTHPSHHLCDLKQLRLKSTVSIQGITLPNPKLITFHVVDHLMTVVGVVKRNSTYEFICKEMFIAVTKKDDKLRHSLRLHGKHNESSIDEDKHFIDSIVSFLQDSLTTPSPLPQTIQEPTMIASTRWMSPLDHASHLVVAMGTTDNRVVIFEPRDFAGTHQIIEVTSPAVELQFSSLNDPHQVLLAICLQSGLIQCWDYLTSSLLAESTQTEAGYLQFPISLTWSDDNKYIFVGTEIGQVAVYQLTDNTLVQCQLVQACSASCTCLKWSKQNRILLVGSQDTKVHILAMRSSPPDGHFANNKHSIMNYFPPLKNTSQKLYYSGVMKGHQSFVSSILLHDNNLVMSVGWDNHTMIWSMKSVDGVTLSTEVTEIEPDMSYKLGIHDYITFLPCDICAITDNKILIVYQGMCKELSFGLY